MYTHQADDETSKLFKRRKMHVILCRVVLYIKRKNLFTVCDWCLLSACVSNLCVSCETLHCLAQALSGFCTWMWYRWNTQFVLFFIFHNQKYWIVLQMLQSGCCTWMWCMWNTHCVSKNQLCSSCLSIWISHFVVLQSSFFCHSGYSVYSVYLNILLCCTSVQLLDAPSQLQELCLADSFPREFNDFCISQW